MHAIVLNGQTSNHDITRQDIVQYVEPPKSASTNKLPNGFFLLFLLLQQTMKVTSFLWRIRREIIMLARIGISWTKTSRTWLRFWGSSRVGRPSWVREIDPANEQRKHCLFKTCPRWVKMCLASIQDSRLFHERVIMRDSPVIPVKYKRTRSIWQPWGLVTVVMSFKEWTGDLASRSPNSKLIWVRISHSEMQIQPNWQDWSEVRN